MKLTKKKLKKYALEIFKDNPNQAFNYKQIAGKLGLNSKHKRRLLISVLDELLKEGKLQEEKKGKYRYRKLKRYAVGRLEFSTPWEAYVYCKELDENVYIPLSNIDHAIVGDKVEVFIYAKRKKSRLIGEVVKVLERSDKLIVGTLKVSDNFAFLLVDHKFMPFDIFIPLQKLNGGKSGDKAVVKITDWPEGAKNPVGKVVDILGHTGTHNAEMNAILLEFDLPYKFPENVEAAAKQIHRKIPKQEYEKRRDFRNILTFTIDPADAKDFDDALSFRQISENKYEVGVHIADVTYYVKEKSIIDKEAEKRGTSVYLVDRVVPMLPETLSNDICSLNPNTEKLTFSVVFTIDINGKLYKRWIGETIIKSDRRFNYDEVQKILDTGKGDYAKQLKILNTIAQNLRKKRIDNGALIFDKLELKFKLDKNGKPLEIYYKTSRQAEQLIEEFMLLANRKIAEAIGKVRGDKKPKTFVYRVHDEPDYDKLVSFKNFIEKFGYKIVLKSPKTIAKSLNKIFMELNNRPEKNVIANYAVRSMARAVYSTDNIGHFGLAFDYYTHFTSPIRRYPDMMVHRLVKRYLLKKQPSVDKEKYEERCKYASEREQLAMNAEWASIKYKAVEFMSDKIGKIFDGLISGITDWAMYVEIMKYKIEGTVLLRNIEEDFYSFDELNYRLIGLYTNKIYQIGDKVRVQIIRADIEKRQLDLKLLS